MSDKENKKVTGTKIDLIDINYRRAAVNIAQNIVGAFESISTREQLLKELESAVYNYTELRKNYLLERDGDVKTEE